MKGVNIKYQKNDNDFSQILSTCEYFLVHVMNIDWQENKEIKI